MPDAIAPFSTARGYVQSAYLIMANNDRYQAPDDTTFYLSFHLLAAFAAELYLKAYLISQGFEERSLRAPDLRHDLAKLHSEAEKLGLADAGARLLVRHLEEHHRSHEFRYINRNTQYRAIDLRSIFNAFSSFDVAVDTAVGASLSVGKQPGGRWEFPVAKCLWRVPGAQQLEPLVV